MKIGLVPGAFRPYHAGHDEIVRQAAKENDKVIIFASSSDRESVSGKAMEKIWRDQIEPTLPGNVEIVYGGSPVRNAFKVMGDAANAGSQDTYIIYSDPDDADRFNDQLLEKYASGLNVIRRPIERTSTVDISGTKMRGFLASGDKESFLKYLPPSLNGDAVWDTLLSMQPQLKAPKGSGKHAAATKAPAKPLKGEALLRSYIRNVLLG